MEASGLAGQEDENRLRWDDTDAERTRRQPTNRRAAVKRLIAMLLIPGAFCISAGGCGRSNKVETADEESQERVEGHRVQSRWDSGKPASTLNIAFTHLGLAALDLPDATIDAFAAMRESDSKIVDAGGEGAASALFRLRATASYREMVAAQIKREARKDILAKFFARYDVIVMPIDMVAAFPHQQERTREQSS